MTCPPGDEIYRDNEKKISMFEVNGVYNAHYSENLCYLAKLFLDHKTLLYDTNVFTFLVLCEFDEYGHHIVGFFSKEKFSPEGYNLNCVLVLPYGQKKGYGNFLIRFSYELSKIEKRVGTPERPLSDMARFVYLKWWMR